MYEGAVCNGCGGRLGLAGDCARCARLHSASSANDTRSFTPRIRTHSKQGSVGRASITVKLSPVAIAIATVSAELRNLWPDAANQHLRLLGMRPAPGRLGYAQVDYILYRGEQ